MNNFTTLKQLPLAKKYLKAEGFEIKKDKLSRKGGRVAFFVSDAANIYHLNDYELLSFANCGGWFGED